MTMLRRLILIIIILGLAHLYVALSFYQATGRNCVWLITSVLFILTVMMPVLQRQEERWNKARPWLRPILTLGRIVCPLALGIFSLLFIFSVLRDSLLLLSHFFISTANYAWASEWSLKTEIALVLAVLLVGVVQALMGPRVKRIQVPIAGLPKPFEGFRIVQISDLHIGPTIRRGYVQNVVRIVNANAADIIALTGDITDGSLADLSEIARELSKMQSTFGRYFVTGNHEYYWNAPAWIQFHREQGTHVLINESRRIENAGAAIAILGVPDVSAHHFVAAHRSDPQLAAAGVAPETIKILLAHQPVSYKGGALAGVHLQLSGHTHSGQFFPWNLLIGFFHDYSRGLNRFKDMWIYVNPGTGYWGPPLRAGVASEITVITLTCA